MINIPDFSDFVGGIKKRVGTIKKKVSVARISIRAKQNLKRARKLQSLREQRIRLHGIEKFDTAEMKEKAEIRKEKEAIREFKSQLPSRRIARGAGRILVAGAKFGVEALRTPPQPRDRGAQIDSYEPRIHAPIISRRKVSYTTRSSRRLQPRRKKELGFFATLDALPKTAREKKAERGTRNIKRRGIFDY